MQYQQPTQPQDPRVMAFAQAANRYFDSIDWYVRTECGRLQTLPNLASKDLVNLGNRLENHRQAVYRQFLAEVHANARLASGIVDRDEALKDVFGDGTTGYARQALAHYRVLLELRVLRTATMEASRNRNPPEMWRVLEQYANMYNVRNPNNPIHTRLSPRGQTYDVHFGGQNPELDFFQLIPILDTEIQTSVRQDPYLANINPKAFFLLGQEIIKRIDLIVAHDAQATQQRLGEIKQDAFARVARSRRTTTMLQIKTHVLEDLLRSSAADEK